MILKIIIPEKTSDNAKFELLSFRRNTAIKYNAVATSEDIRLIINNSEKVWLHSFLSFFDCAIALTP